MSFRRGMRRWRRKVLDAVSGARTKDPARWLRTIAIIAVVNGTLIGLGQLVYIAWAAHDPLTLGVADGLRSLCVTSLLIAGGVLLLLRRRIGRLLLVIWAVICLISRALSSVVLLAVYADLPAHVKAAEQTNMAIRIGFSGGLVIYAILILIWMTRRFVEREMRRWW